MASTSETGHDVNLANFKIIIDKCTEFGVDYNPTNTDITVLAMTTKLTAVNLLQNDYIACIGSTKIPIDDREVLFEKMRGIAVRTVNSYCSVKATKQAKKDAKGLLRKITGSNVKIKRLENGDPDPKYVSNSQMSFVKRTTNFETLISLLEADTLYGPNETILTIVSLKALAAEMNAANSGMSELIAILEKKRQDRNAGLYMIETGIIDLALSCKNYVRSVFGAKSQQDLAVSSIKLRRFMKLKPVTGD